MRSSGSRGNGRPLPTIPCRPSYLMLGDVSRPLAAGPATARPRAPHGPPLQGSGTGTESTLALVSTLPPPRREDARPLRGRPRARRESTLATPGSRPPSRPPSTPRVARLTLESGSLFWGDTGYPHLDDLSPPGLPDPHLSQLSLFLGQHRLPTLG